MFWQKRYTQKGNCCFNTNLVTTFYEHSAERNPVGVTLVPTPLLIILQTLNQHRGKYTCTVYIASTCNFVIAVYHNYIKIHCHGNKFLPKRTKMALPVPTKSVLETSSDVAMLFTPFGCTHPPPPIPPFLLKQNLSPKDIARSDIMKFRDHDGYIRYGPERVN